MASKYVSLTDKEREGILALQIPPTLRKKIERASTRITHRSAKAKGQKLQYDFCELLSKTLGLHFDNQDDDSPLASRPSGQHGDDIILRGEAKKRLPFSFEAKCVESLSLVSAIEQAKENAGDKDWIVIHRKKALKEDIAIMDIKTLMMFLTKGGF